MAEKSLTEVLMGRIARLETENKQLREEKQALIEDIKSYAPYVRATLPVPGTELTKVTTSNPEWTAVHRGRAASSYSMLTKMIELAEKLGVRP